MAGKSQIYAWYTLYDFRAVPDGKKILAYLLNGGRHTVREVEVLL